MTKENKDIIPIEEQPYAVPANWQWVRLGAINIYKSKNITLNKEGNRTYELYSVPSYAEAYPEIISESEIGSSKQLVQKNDVLLCKINPRINRVWKVFSYTTHQTLASSEWIVVRNNVLYMAYLMWSFRCPYFRTYMLSNVSGVGGSLMRARPQFVKEYPVPIPPLQEQKRIVECITKQFSKLDKAKERIQSVLDSSETRKAAILHKAFTGELTASWRKNKKINRSSWRQCKIGNLCNVVRGGSPRPAGSPEFYGGNIPFMKVADITRNNSPWVNSTEYFIKEAGLKKTRIVEANTLLLTNSGATLGVPAICTFQTTFNDGIAAFLNLDSRSVMFFYYFWSSQTKYLRAINKGAAQPNLNTDIIKNIKIDLPSIEEQREIVRILDDLLTKEQHIVDIAAATLQRIDTMKQAILAKAFRGELGTNDPSEPPAPLTAKGDLSC